MSDEIIRLNININAECARVIEDGKKLHSITATEVVRRALSVYEFMQHEQLSGSIIHVVKGGTDREVVFL